MPRCASRHAVSQFISRVHQNSGLRRSEFIRALGYRNVTGGLRALDQWLDHGEGHDSLLDRIRQMYPLDREELDAALAVTRTAMARERETLEREQFRPFIHVLGESRIPSSITLFAVTGGRWNLIEIPENLAKLSFAEQIPALVELMRAYLENDGGFCPFFGKVTGFRVVHWDESFRFDSNCKFMERSAGRFRRPRTTVTIDGKPLEWVVRLR